MAQGIVQKITLEIDKRSRDKVVADAKATSQAVAGEFATSSRQQSTGIDAVAAATERAAKRERAARAQAREELMGDIRTHTMYGRQVDATSAQAVAAWRKEAQAIREQAKELGLGRLQVLQMDAGFAAVEKRIESATQTTNRFGAMGQRAANASVAVAFGLEAIARGGVAAEGGVRTALRAVASLGAAFGPEGLIVSGVAAGLAAVLDMFDKTREEAKKTADDMRRSFRDLIDEASIETLKGEQGLQQQVVARRQEALAAAQGRVLTLAERQKNPETASEANLRAYGEALKQVTREENILADARAALAYTSGRLLLKEEEAEAERQKRAERNHGKSPLEREIDELIEATKYDATRADALRRLMAIEGELDEQRRRNAGTLEERTRAEADLAKVRGATDLGAGFGIHAPPTPTRVLTTVPFDMDAASSVVKAAKAAGADVDPFAGATAGAGAMQSAVTTAVDGIRDALREMGKDAQEALGGMASSADVAKGALEGATAAAAKAVFGGGNVFKAMLKAAGEPIVKKLHAKAVEHAADAVGFAAHLNFPLAAQNVLAAAGFEIAAQKVSSITGGQGAGKESGGAMPSGNPTPSAGGAMAGSAGGVQRGPEIHLHIDGLDPSNARHQELVGEAARQMEERWGGRIVFAGGGIQKSA